MKTKGLVLSGLTILLASILAGCSRGNDSSSKKSKDDNTKIVKVEKRKSDKYYFKNNKLVIRDIDIEITKTKVIPVGEVGNEYGDKPIIAFWYKVTNKTTKEIDANTAWIAVFNAVQNNNKNTVNKLDVAALPDEKYLDSQTQTIKKNGIVENAVAYNLDDTTTPVKLTATKGVGGKNIGTMTFKLQ
ncbi:DUF5067 domain-containing protein [Companilactobacillus keshanensis]|uniref:DUF5067 domain-containing protein n=1 Tax=Companilactobacillus keshanensis TaxID=2486003 RepID=A0ABW4BWF5_9LACO|nr:DUF5067 domain-containing protein [Companilactobacillus keshanensis]